MEANLGSSSLWVRVSECISDVMGLHFTRERWGDLQRGLSEAADELGLIDGVECAEWLLTGRLKTTQLRVLASHLTVGETYFFREKKTFEVLAKDVLPELIHARRGREQRLRLWSAACCTGEEPYSLAILLSQLIPDLANWQVTILATDINERFLQKAAVGEYGEWSFRETPPSFKDQYFKRTSEGRYAILPEFKKRVTFANLNLVEDVYPSLATDTNAMDVIFCRNVLMYFTPRQASKVVQSLHRSLVDGGLLVVSPSEGSQATYANFVPLNRPEAILYRKSRAEIPRASVTEAKPFQGEGALHTNSWTWPPADEPPAPIAQAEPGETISEPDEIAALKALGSSCADAVKLYEQGRYAETVEFLLPSIRPNSPPEPPVFSLLARALANQGKLAEALVWCDRWVAADKLDSASHYLRAMILQELGDHVQARHSLQRALYLDQDFVLAHFALGNVARDCGESAEADKHFANALHLLRKYTPGDLLPEADGLTAGRLTEIITSVVAMETAS